MVCGAGFSGACRQNVSGIVAVAMSARDDILRSIRLRKPASLARPPAYARAMQDDLVERFAACASAANATVRVLESADEVPGRISELLRARNLAAAVHLPPDSELEKLDWKDRVSVSHAPPGPDDTAVSLAPFGIAETGTLAFSSGAGRPASWHFRAGFEIAILHSNGVVADIEAVMRELRKSGWPATLNLVTGPSRTADIEQTLELGAHGPKALAILLIRERPAG
jgi:L-lactate dehydrogenase complex protein LldG